MSAWWIQYVGTQVNQIFTLRRSNASRNTNWEKVHKLGGPLTITTQWKTSTTTAVFVRQEWPSSTSSRDRMWMTLNLMGSALICITWQPIRASLTSTRQLHVSLWIPAVSATISTMSTPPRASSLAALAVLMDLLDIAPWLILLIWQTLLLWITACSEIPLIVTLLTDKALGLSTSVDLELEPFWRTTLSSLLLFKTGLMCRTMTQDNASSTNSLRTIMMRLERLKEWWRQWGLFWYWGLWLWVY